MFACLFLIDHSFSLHISDDLDFVQPWINPYHIIASFMNVLTLEPACLLIGFRNKGKAHFVEDTEEQMFLRFLMFLKMRSNNLLEIIPKGESPAIVL